MIPDPLPLTGLTAWHDTTLQQWCLGWQPTAVLVARNKDQLHALPHRVDAALANEEGGLAVGCLSYEAGLTLHGLPSRAEHTDACVYIYPRTHLWSGSLAQMLDLYGTAGAPFQLATTFRSEQTPEQYRAHFRRIQEYLLAGDCYQINFARRFSAGFRGDPFAGWLHLLSHHPSPHASFFALPDGGAIFGISPERLLGIQEGVVVTEPIKGSRPRGASRAEDLALEQELRGSAKDKAENLMIVDLLRNDLGKISTPGSVTAAPLFELRTFSNVHHLVSTVRGKLRHEVDPLSALLACFPGGSITGTPKRRAMEIIEELEPSARGFYCGTQFRLDGRGKLDSNILIRTFQTEGSFIHAFGGGGIVADSNVDDEYAETDFKIRALMNSL